MVNRYETVFILTPVLSDEQMKEAVKKFTDLLVNKGANVVYEDNWGLRKLAYPIQKKSTGFYHLIEFEAEGTLINDLEIAFRRDERVIRFLTTVLDKHAIAYNEKKRKDKKTDVVAEEA
jgi:small subunit ribosomal protein S6